MDVDAVEIFFICMQLGIFFFARCRMIVLARWPVIHFSPQSFLLYARYGDKTRRDSWETLTILWTKALLVCQ